MKMAIDVHGTYDTDPERFDRLINHFSSVHGPIGNSPIMEFFIFSGSPAIESEEFISTRNLHNHIKRNIKYLSVVDFMKDHNFPMVQRASTRTGCMSWYFDGPEEVWWSLKAVICRIDKIDVLIDDKVEYGDYFSPLEMKYVEHRHPTLFVHYHKGVCKYLQQLEEMMILNQYNNLEYINELSQ